MRAAPLLLALLLSSPAAAATIVIDFEAVALGAKGESFEVAPGITLASVDGLYVTDRYGTRGLLVGEEGGTLQLTFSVPVVSLSIDFGNDSDAADVDPSSAFLTGKIGGVVVVTDSELANRNGLPDQTLTVALPGGFGAAGFSFGQSDFYEPISPFVDNIVVTTLEVPEPAGLLLGALLLSTRLRIGGSRSTRTREAASTAR
jgi:hypothetical protein